MFDNINVVSALDASRQGLLYLVLKAISIKEAISKEKLIF